MKTPISIHISSVERLFNDGLINSKDYQDIMFRIMAEKLKEKEQANNG